MTNPSPEKDCDCPRSCSSLWTRSHISSPLPHHVGRQERGRWECLPASPAGPPFFCLGWSWPEVSEASLAGRSRGSKKFALGFSRHSRRRLGGHGCFLSFILPPHLGESSPSPSWRVPCSSPNDCLKWTPEHVMPLLQLPVTTIPPSAFSPGSLTCMIWPDAPGLVAPNPLR